MIGMDIHNYNFLNSALAWMHFFPVIILFKKLRSTEAYNIIIEIILKKIIPNQIPSLQVDWPRAALSLATIKALSSPGNLAYLHKQKMQKNNQSQGVLGPRLHAGSRSTVVAAAARRHKPI